MISVMNDHEVMVNECLVLKVMIHLSIVVTYSVTVVKTLFQKRDSSRHIV